MTEVVFLDRADDESLRFAAVVSRYRGKWVLCRRKGRSAFGVPGGRRKDGENIEETARRGLYEETGAARFRLTPVCVYAVREDGEKKTCGMLYFAEIQEFFSLPGSGTERVGYFGTLPPNLTDPLIEPRLVQKAAEAAEKAE